MLLFIKGAPYIIFYMDNKRKEVFFGSDRFE